MSISITERFGDLSETTSADDLVKPIKDKIGQGRDDRKRLEPVWQSNMAFAAGKFWLEWDRDRRTLVMPNKLWGKDLYTADVITEYRTVALGELGSDDDRPELLLRRDDEASEDFQEQLNKAVGFGWDHEWKADEQLEIARRLCIDLGTSAIQCHWDTEVGPPVGLAPHVNNKPVYDKETLYGEGGILANGPNPQVQIKQVRRGGICWRPLSPFNLIVPPGIPNEGDFPWECVVRPVPIDQVRATYGDAAAELTADTDIGSLLGLDTNSEMSVTSALGGPGGSANTSRVRGHVWLFTYYERASDKYPQGRTVYLGGNKMKFLGMEPSLPYQAPDGTWRSGIAYFHWWRVTGRFWSRSLIEAMKDAQRGINKHRTQMTAIIDRGLPFVLIEEGTGQEKRKGVPLEVIPIKKQGVGQPVIHPGIGPGGWMQQQIEAIREDLEHATGIHGPRIGENPANVTTYSQLALISENDQTKREHIYRAHKIAIARLVEDSVYDMRTYWGPQRQIDLAGDDDRVDAMVFDATKIPSFYIVKVARGSAKPRSQAAELTKIDQLWAAALAAQIVMSDPSAWVDWYFASMNAGQALTLPTVKADAQTHKASLENHRMLQGEQVPVAYYDPPQVHIPIHRNAQIQAEQVNDHSTWQLIEAHIQAHQQAALENQMELAQHVAGAQQMPGQPQPTPVPEPGAGQQGQPDQAAQAQQLQQMVQNQQQHEQKMTHAEESHQMQMRQAQQQQQNPPSK